MHALPVRTRLTSPSAVPIAQLQLTVMRRLDGLLAGDHAGLFPGHGTERGEARPYIPGDDPRHIDWAVTARITLHSTPCTDWRRRRWRSSARGRNPHRVRPDWRITR